MKKRQFPVLLVTAIVLLVGGAAVYNIYNTRTANMTPEQAQMEAQRQAMEAQRDAMAKNPPPSNPKAPDPKQLRAAVQQGIKGSAAGPEGAPPGPMGRPGMDGPSILAPENKPYKPMPNESATSSQWFNKK